MVLKEDPEKLICMSENGSYIFLRTDDKKGVKTIHIQDGSKVDECKNIHKAPIL